MKLSPKLKRLFEAEFNNEDVGGRSRDGTSAPGGVNPATLESTLDSLNQGIYESESLTKKLSTELEKLISRHGEDTPVTDFI